MNEVKYYRKKPVVIQAYQTDKVMYIETLEGTHKANVGDFIITGVHGEQYPCKPDIFQKTYEQVTEKDYLALKDRPIYADIIGVSSADIQLNLNFAEFNRVTNALNKLADYEDAEETGTLVRLPCKVGTRVYEIVDDCTYGDDCYTKRMCKTCDFRDLYIEIKILDRISEIVSRLSSFGKTVFLTREDAEKALKERDGK